MSAKPLQEKWKFSRNFIKIFQQLYQFTSKCLSNFLKRSAKLPLEAYGKNYSGRGARSLKMLTQSMTY